MIDLSATALTADERDLLGEGRVAAVCLFGRNVVDRYQVAEYVADLRSLAGEDLIVAIDQEGGGVLRLRDVPYPPAAMALGAADDVELTKRVAAAAGRGLRSVGVNLDFAPVADVNSNAENPVIADRSFGSDPALVSRHVAAFVRGLQGEGVAATLKHFPGHGDTAVDSHLALPVLRHTADHLDSVDLPPFRAGIAAGVAAVMSAHILMPELDATMPATLSRAAMHGLLRTELGFDGVIVTDALDMRAISDTWPAPEAAVMSLVAGADLPLVIGTVAENRAVLDAVDAAAAHGRLAAAEYAASRQRVAALAARYAATSVDPAAAWRADGSDETLLGEAALRGLVARGDVPRLRRGDRVVLVARETVFTNAAAQVTVRPADSLEAALRTAGVEVTRFAVDDVDLDEVALHARATNRAPAAAALIYASTSRTRVKPDEAQTARALADVARAVSLPYVHVALWNPYSADGLPGPTLLAFGHAPREAAAVARRLVAGDAAS